MKQEYGLEKLNVWKKAMEFAVWVCRDVVTQLPKEERYALGDQLRRAVQSIPANIAEGYGRYYYQDNIRFCYIARGSLEEVRSHLIFAQEMNYLPREVLQRGEEDLVILRKLISGYISYLKTSRPGAHEPGGTIQEEETNYEIAEHPETG